MKTRQNKASLTCPTKNTGVRSSIKHGNTTNNDKVLMRWIRINHNYRYPETNKMNDLSHDLAAIEGALHGQDETIFQSWKRIKELLLPLYPGGYPPTTKGGVRGNVSYLAWHLHKIALTGKKPLPNSEGLEWLLYRYVAATEEVTQLIQEIVGEGKRP